MVSPLENHICEAIGLRGRDQVSGLHSKRPSTLLDMYSSNCHINFTATKYEYNKYLREILGREMTRSMPPYLRVDLTNNPISPRHRNRILIASNVRPTLSGQGKNNCIILFVLKHALYAINNYTGLFLYHSRIKNIFYHLLCK